MDRERLDEWCERGILGLVLAILVYSPLALGAVQLAQFVVIEWLVVALLFVWGCRFWQFWQLVAGPGRRVGPGEPWD